MSTARSWCPGRCWLIATRRCSSAGGSTSRSRRRPSFGSAPSCEAGAARGCSGWRPASRLRRRCTRAPTWLSCARGFESNSTEPVTHSPRSSTMPTRRGRRACGSSGRFRRTGRQGHRSVRPCAAWRRACGRWLSVAASVVSVPGAIQVGGQQPGKQHPRNAGPLADHRGARNRCCAGVSGTCCTVEDTAGYPIVELGGIEPPSVRWSPNLIRPFPQLGLDGYRTGGSAEVRGPHRRVFPRCQRSFTPSVVFPYGPSPLLLPGCGDPAPCAIAGHDFAHCRLIRSGGESELLILGGSFGAPV